MATVIRREPRIVSASGTRKAAPGSTYPVVRCTCGSEVHCSSSWANECRSCGTEFNGSGQTLAPRHFWGEETGETF